VLSPGARTTPLGPGLSPLRLLFGPPPDSLLTRLPAMRGRLTGLPSVSWMLARLPTVRARLTGLPTVHARLIGLTPGGRPGILARLSPPGRRGLSRLPPGRRRRR